MEVGAYLFGMVKKNTKLFFREINEKLTKDQPGGSYLMLSSKSVEPSGRELIASRYKFNMWKVLYLVVTDNTGNTQEGLPYFYMYPDQFFYCCRSPFFTPLCRV